MPRLQASSAHLAWEQLYPFAVVHWLAMGGHPWCCDVHLSGCIGRLALRTRVASSTTGFARLAELFAQVRE